MSGVFYADSLQELGSRLVGVRRRKTESLVATSVWACTEPKTMKKRIRAKHVQIYQRIALDGSSTLPASTFNASLGNLGGVFYCREFVWVSTWNEFFKTGRSWRNPSRAKSFPLLRAEPPLVSSWHSLAKARVVVSWRLLEFLLGLELQIHSC